MYIKYAFALMLLQLSSTAFGQMQVNFLPMYEGEYFDLNLGSFQISGEEKTIELFKFFISNVRFYDDEKLVFTEENSYHLIDAENPESLSFTVDVLPETVYSKVSFLLGIDSITNVSGAFGGDLDPTNGMYWTWQSGYINFKLEGTDAECPARNHFYQFHIGGYQAPFHTIQEISFPFEDEVLNVAINIDTIFNNIDFSKDYHVMSPGEKAVNFSKLLSTVFFLKND